MEFRPHTGKIVPQQAETEVIDIHSYQVFPSVRAEEYRPEKTKNVYCMQIKALIGSLTKVAAENEVNVRIVEKKFMTDSKILAKKTARQTEF